MIEGTVTTANIVFKSRRMMICHLSDDTGKIILRFFHFSNAQLDAMKQNPRIRCFGEIRSSGQTLEIIHPEYSHLKANKTIVVDDTLTAHYPSTTGLQQRSIRRLIKLALEHSDDLVDLLPSQGVDIKPLYSLDHAIRLIHMPTPDTDTEALLEGSHPAQQRLILEELVAHHISLRQLRENSKKQPSVKISNQQQLVKQLLARLPYQLTKAQQRVIKEINLDLQQSYPMSRLVQGDVGSGKTVVAAAAALMVIESGYQVALMAPTEILAEQHYTNFTEWFEALGLKVGWFTGKQKAKERRDNNENCALGLTHIAIGTHALFQGDLQFQKLGLIIVDEQHRFGVDQRLALREKGKQGDYYPHQLIMTATPIPRTLAMTACADLDYSVINELPPGRTPITTVALSNHRREEVINKISHYCADGKQVYWVCTLIEESEALQSQNAEETVTLLTNALPDISIGLVHGRMKSEEKQCVMSEFKAGHIALLVATTVIEVGVDVPNASLIIIENAERLGLAQLHQLRGRVGRGTTASTCLLLYQSPLSKNGHQRINALRNSNDGFEIAKIDLAMRGPGEVFGNRQTGVLRFKLADLSHDQYLLPQAQSIGQHIIETDQILAKILTQRWIIQSKDYGNV